MTYHFFSPKCFHCGKVLGVSMDRLTAAELIRHIADCPGLPTREEKVEAIKDVQKKRMRYDDNSRRYLAAMTHQKRGIQ